MKTKHLAILDELHVKLEQLKETIKDASLLAEAAVKLIDTVIVEVNELFMEYEFPTIEDEIHFFKIARPQFLSLLFFYNCVYKFEASKPEFGKREIKKYLLEHRLIVKCYSVENKEFYKYHKSGNTCFDQIYFVRSKHDIKKCVNSFLFIIDDRFCTNHCYLSAKILANKLFSDYLENCFLELKNSPTIVLGAKSKTTKANWTGSKVALIELTYALHEDCVVNNGNIEVKEIIACLETAFNISLAYHNATFLELRQRKNGKTKYLDNLKEKLLRRMEKEEV
jgi:hypothetical protein